MPELPEVETVVRILRPRLEGRTVTGASVRWRRTVGARDFERKVIGARVTRVWRRAKYIVADLERKSSPAGSLVGHLRMTGMLHVQAIGYERGPHDRVELALDDGKVLHFTDARKFGRLQFHADPRKVFSELGPEPLSDEFKAEWFHAALKSKRRLLKPLLLDQTFVAGLGNIYVDESLHRAGLHPLTRSDRVTLASANKLHDSIRAVLAEAIAREGSSFDAWYRTPDGNAGSFQDEFRVYGREGEQCLKCGTDIVRIVVGQRGTHFCPQCQARRARH
jgi:formamidopyrimidine-DNA glycosylase